MVRHKFTADDRVIVVLDKNNTNVRLGIYTVVRALPLAGFGPQYRVKHILDSYERVIDEVQLRAA